MDGNSYVGDDAAAYKDNETMSHPPKELQVQFVMCGNLISLTRQQPCRLKLHVDKCFFPIEFEASITVTLLPASEHKTGIWYCVCFV